MADYSDFTYRGAVDIIAQTIGNIAVNIAAQTLAAMAINITTQDLAELIISINAQTIGIYVERDWATKSDYDKTLFGTFLVLVGDSHDILDYTVPDDLVVYIDEVVFSIQHQGEAKLQIGGDTILDVYLAAEAIETFTFTTPKKATAGEHIIVTMWNYDATFSNNCNATISGRELAA